ncbi:MAG TPA: ABC transporter substrate-binding protein [Stellaceae bacterium]|nr:ABC transporter substrate-binding protein [Stellaceae bacterium]
MNRRDLVMALAGAIAAARPLRAEEKPMRIVGFLGIASPATFSDAITAFREGLRGQGYVEGGNVAVQYRWAAGDAAKLPALAAELVQMRVDVIATSGGTLPTLAALAATKKIPIVSSSAAVFIRSFARPGANVTGVGNQTAELTPKRLELLHQTVPAVKLIGFLFNPGQGLNAGKVKKEAEAAAAKLGIRLAIAEARGEADFERAFGELSKTGVGALLPMPDPVFFARHRALVALAARYKLPAIYEWREEAVDGGLMAYGDSFSALYRRVGDYVGRILKGAKPADLPVEQPGVIRLVVNLKTAKALGLTIPPSILARADEAIE